MDPYYLNVWDGIRWSLNTSNHIGAKYYFDKAFEMDPNNELAKKIFTSVIKKR
jgi:hypothetical protein